MKLHPYGWSWIYKKPQIEIAIDLKQWLIGANYYTEIDGWHGYNIFFLCFRIGSYNRM